MDPCVFSLINATKLSQELSTKFFKGKFWVLIQTDWGKGEDVLKVGQVAFNSEVLQRHT